MNILYTRQFIRSFSKLPKNIQEIYRIKEQIFKENPSHPLLGVHKIKELNCYSFVVTYKIRVIFKFKNNNAVFINIGDHSIYRKGSK
jgi:mRNA-degrading endonuclease RelE of RelBE toxin-antitoxin system